MKVLIGLALLALITGAAIAPAQTKGDVQAGKAVYDTKCKTCHAAKGEGNAALAKTLKVTFKDLASKEVQSKSDDDLKKNIADGVGKMLPVKGLADKQLQDITAFLRSLAKS